MGRGNLDKDFLSGLRSMAMLYPLTVAAAKYHAGSRRSSTVEVVDVDYACAMVEHAHGRLAVLRQPFVQKIENLLMDPMMFARVCVNV
jgi:hypothetical protein